MRKSVVCALIAVTTAIAFAKGPPDLAGTYTITAGAMPNKTKYVGKVVLTKKSALTYDVAWTTGASGESKASGIAHQGDKYLAAGFGGKTNAAGVYDGSNCDMNGDTNFICATSANADEANGGVGNHMFTPDAKTGMVGTFDTQAWDGDTNVKTVKIAKAKGTVYTLTWTFEDGHKVDGIGIMADKKLYWAASRGAGFGLALYKISGKVLDGQWVMAGGTDLGTEKLGK